MPLGSLKYLGSINGYCKGSEEISHDIIRVTTCDNINKNQMNARSHSQCSWVAAMWVAKERHYRVSVTTDNKCAQEKNDNKGTKDVLFILYRVSSSKISKKMLLHKISQPYIHTGVVERASPALSLDSSPGTTGRKWICKSFVCINNLCIK